MCKHSGGFYIIIFIPKRCFSFIRMWGPQRFIIRSTHTARKRNVLSALSEKTSTKRKRCPSESRIFSPCSRTTQILIFFIGNLVGNQQFFFQINNPILCHLKIKNVKNKKKNVKIKCIRSQYSEHSFVNHSEKGSVKLKSYSPKVCVFLEK